MKRLVECVPNFSEGQDRAIIDKIVAAIAAVEGVKVLDVDPGADTNRTVVTFVAAPEVVGEGAFQGIRAAAEIIDMRKHKGAHPRMGATDVCPFIPVAGITMEECAQIARETGERVARELGIPIYLYEAAAACPERRNLANVREGEYEGLAEKLTRPEWKPDFGEAVFNARSGATVMGAREFLIAYNINFNTRDKALLNDIAFTIREKGKARRDAKGALVKDASGATVFDPGLFRDVKAIGWYIPQYNCAQISINFTNYKVSPVHAVFDKVCALAAEKGLRVTGSELVGLIPKEALLEAGRYFLQKQGKPPGVHEEELIHVAVRSLGLADVTPFEPAKKIVEYQVEADHPPVLVRMNLREFANELASDSPAPGGGSVSALAGALSAALSAMVSNLTAGKKGYEAVREDMARIGVAGQELKDAFLADIDLDTEAFNKVMAALGLPRKTEAEKAERAAALEEANKGATLIPLRVLQRTVETLRLAAETARKGNRNSLSDAGVAGLMGRAAAMGACYNVFINLPGITDAAFAEKVRGEARAALEEARTLADEIEGVLQEALK